MKLETLQALTDVSGPASLALVTALRSGHHWILRADAAGRVAPQGADTPAHLVGHAEAAIRDDRSALVEEDGEAYFVRPFLPPVRVILVGAVHVAQSLAPMAALAGFHVVVVDPRPVWLTDFRLPNVDRVRAWPAAAFEELQPDHRTAIVTLTHDPKVDDPALVAALASPAFYVGALGSKRTHGKRLNRLKEAGFDDDALARIHAPVGLDLGARTPPEIAVSVRAELVGALRRPH